MRCAARAYTTLLGVVFTVAFVIAIHELGLGPVSVIGTVMYVLTLATAMTWLAGARHAALASQLADPGIPTTLHIARTIAGQALAAAGVLTLAAGSVIATLVWSGVEVWTIAFPAIPVVYAIAVALRAVRVLRAPADAAVSANSGRVFVVHGGRLIGWLPTSRAQLDRLHRGILPSARVVR